MTATPVPVPCHQPLPPDALHGVELFNAGRFFDAHEALETAWRAESGEIRYLYQGILQVGVGYYHIQRGNPLGARKLLTSALDYLARFPDECQGVDVARLRADARRVLDWLERTPPALIGSFDQTLFTHIRLIAPPEPG